MTELETQYHFVSDSVGVADVGSRGRVCVTGADRMRFLNGQVTNNVKDLVVGQGCYAALVNAKGKLQSDLNIYRLADELLLDFEPGLTAVVIARLEKYIIADDVEVIDVGSNYGMLTVQGPRSAEVVSSVALAPPDAPMQWSGVKSASGDVYCMNNARGAVRGFDLFMPTPQREDLSKQLAEAAKKLGGGSTGMEALEVIRIEAGIPRFGIDMDESNLAPEAIEARAISYAKGCYIGQEVISRIRAFGQVAKSLRGLRLPRELNAWPKRGDKLFRDGKEAGYITSATRSPKYDANIALGYVRREHNAAGAQLEAVSPTGRFAVQVCDLPFTRETFK
jgi:folate-binding protein YgfZ